MTPEQLDALRKPFPSNAIGRKPRGGTQLDFVGHANVTDRLLTVDPAWSWEPYAVDEMGLPKIISDAKGQSALWIKLTVCGVTRIGIGTCEKTANDPLKELIGDALRNAAMRFGVALDLWAREDLESSSASPPTPSSVGSPRSSERHTKPAARAKAVAKAASEQAGGVATVAEQPASEKQKETIRSFCKTLGIEPFEVLPYVGWSADEGLLLSQFLTLARLLGEAEEAGLAGEKAINHVHLGVSA